MQFRALLYYYIVSYKRIVPDHAYVTNHCKLRGVRESNVKSTEKTQTIYAKLLEFMLPTIFIFLTTWCTNEAPFLIYFATSLHVSFPIKLYESFTKTFFLLHLYKIVHHFNKKCFIIYNIRFLFLLPIL